MRTYRSPRKLLTEIEQILASNRPTLHHSPLEKVVDLLSKGRRYSWAAIYLIAGNNGSQRLLGAGAGPQPGQMARAESKSKILISVRIAGRELGVLDVESDRENAFGSEDRVLLENVAALLARFLTASGKYLVRNAKSATPSSLEASAASR